MLNETEKYPQCPEKCVSLPAERNARVLLAVHEPLIRTFIRIALPRDGYRVMEAGSASEASRIWYQHAGTIGVAIVDDELGDASTAVELVKRFGRADPGLKVLLAASEPAHGEHSDGNASRREVLRKPFDLGQLSDAMKRIAPR